MIRRFNSRGQSTAEYAIVLALVVGAVVAMQVYVRRGINQRIKIAVDHTGTGGKVGTNSGADFAYSTKQYEPYYLTQDTSSASSTYSNDILGNRGEVGRVSRRASVTARKQTMGWDGTATTLDTTKKKDKNSADAALGEIPVETNPVTSEILDDEPGAETGG